MSVENLERRTLLASDLRELVIIDGVSAIGTLLANYRDLAAIHIVSHGSPGAVRLGDTTLSAGNLDAYREVVRSWGDALKADGDILIYGCQVAAGPTGADFVDELARLTGADVGASDDVTGSPALGGDWAFEYSSGDVTSRLAFGPEVSRDWSGTLESFNQNDLVVLDKQRTDGALKLEVVTAYILVVDSNVETPASYGPEAAHLAVRIINTSTTTTLTDIVVNIGDLINIPAGTGTPGDYPDTIVDVGYFGGYSGSFQLHHEGGGADAQRFIPSLAPGASVVQYFFVSYPTTDAGNNTLAGAASVTADDLKLYYDVWASATEGVATRRVNEEQKVTLRNEISAMANKVWPNTTGKVPDEYLDAIEEGPGWRPSATPRISGAYVSEGIWYDLGNIGAGFDNNGDLVPDRNAWMQPAGDPSLYDATCMRLAKSYGLVIVKLNDGTEQLIPFEDQLYFENMPENNTGAVGLVFYEYLPLASGCTAALSPYQEVASGYDNEKFNGD
ncbi:MAG TPA: DUF4347 domain-containing protein, partial [Pirellulaceae bacterium]|nr:DUF4347 domain-containing protein [Pirellulaceae bacterium]